MSRQRAPGLVSRVVTWAAICGFGLGTMSIVAGFMGDPYENPLFAWSYSAVEHSIMPFPNDAPLWIFVPMILIWGVNFLVGAVAGGFVGYLYHSLRSK